MANAKLKGLYDKLNNLKEEISSKETELKETKTEIARKEGEVFGSIDELIARGKKIWITKEIPGSDSTWRRYIQKIRGELLMYTFTDVSKAYECPSCQGIVIGEPKIKIYKNINAEGKYYICRICGTQLGDYCEKRV